MKEAAAQSNDPVDAYLSAKVQRVQCVVRYSMCCSLYPCYVLRLTYQKILRN